MKFPTFFPFWKLRRAKKILHQNSKSQKFQKFYSKIAISEDKPEILFSGGREQNIKNLELSDLFSSGLKTNSEINCLKFNSFEDLFVFWISNIIYLFNYKTLCCHACVHRELMTVNFFKELMGILDMLLPVISSSQMKEDFESKI